MSFSANVFRVLIASPSDVKEEREAIRNTINLWNTKNAEHYNLIYLPTMWETNTTPQLGGRPQGMINEQIVDKSDILIGVFWTRIGSPTGIAESGTIEEIERFVDSKKPATLYFSDKPMPQDGFKADQFEKLQEFKQKIRPQGLMGNFSTTEDLERQVDFLLDEHAKKTGKAISDNAPIEKPAITNRKPNFELLFNNMKELKLKLPSVSYKKEFHEHIEYDEIEEYLRKYITREEVEEYNRNIPEPNRVKEYNDKLRTYHLVNEHLSDLLVSVVNTGNLKANSITIDLIFPPEVCVIEKGGSNEWEKPERPEDFPKNPLEKAQNKYTEKLMGSFLPNISMVTGLGYSMINTNYSSVNWSRITKLNAVNRLWVEDNVLTIKIDTLIHTRKVEFEDDVEIVALKDGNYFIDVEIISEELEETICYKIPLIISKE
ncbi:hypothetical protein [Brevibacillus brevis]|uniref:hypothetical protein n=1 Tax=Brevibacillus brevis TaxID=1393 RepID=UPI0007D89E97|nr:hypothetical protein [Brevibacillus brevis]